MMKGVLQKVGVEVIMMVFDFTILPGATLFIHFMTHCLIAEAILQISIERSS